MCHIIDRETKQTVIKMRNVHQAAWLAKAVNDELGSARYLVVVGK